jgi:hypothetical protein
MFEDLFMHPKHITRHREGACAAERERLLRHCAEYGAGKDIDAFRAGAGVTSQTCWSSCVACNAPVMWRSNGRSPLMRRLSQSARSFERLPVPNVSNTSSMQAMNQFDWEML